MPIARTGSGMGNQLEIGMIGMGTMGASMARRLIPKCKVVVFDTDVEAVRGVTSNGAVAAKGIEDLVNQLEAPRTIWLLLPAGDPTESTIDRLYGLLEKGDVAVDGGNSHYRDSIRRAKTLAERGIHLVDVGTSGGQKGAALGYALMVGGDEAVIDRLGPVFASLAADPKRGWGRVGPAGAGHFTKMVHNGVEYGLMRAYAQGLTALESDEIFGFDIGKVTDIWRHGAMARSAILDLTHEVLLENPELGSLAPYVVDVEPARQTREDAVDQIAQRGHDRDQFA